MQVSIVDYKYKVSIIIQYVQWCRLLLGNMQYIQQTVGNVLQYVQNVLWCTVIGYILSTVVQLDVIKVQNKSSDRSTVLN